jgi:hypothetical protein
MAVRALRGLKAFQAQPAQMARKGCKDLLVKQARQVPRGHKAPMESKALSARKVQPEQ